MEIWRNLRPGAAVLACFCLVILSNFPSTAGNQEGKTDIDSENSASVHAHAPNESFQHLVRELRPDPTHPHPSQVRSGETKVNIPGAGVPNPKNNDGQNQQEDLSKKLPVAELDKLKNASRNPVPADFESDRVARAADSQGQHESGGQSDKKSKNGDKDKGKDKDKDDKDDDDDDDDNDKKNKKHTRSLDSLDDIVTKKSGNQLNEIDATLFRAKRFCGFSPKVDPSRLSNASPGQFPWSVAILSNDKVFLCAGTLISDELVLTTASCIAKYRKSTNEALIAVLGAWSLPDRHHQLSQLEVFVRSAVLHPSYSDVDPESRSHNIGILQLVEKIDFDRHPNIFPVCLVAPQFETFATTTDCRILGWPEMPHMEVWRSSSYLSWGDVKIGGNDCSSAGAGTSNMLCATGRTCVANEGSPVVCLSNSNRYYQLGVVPSDVHCEPPSSQASSSIVVVNVLKNHDFIEKYFKTRKV